MDLKNKKAIVTGSSRGIGKAIALELMRRGATVIVTYLSQEDQANEVVKKDKSKKSYTVKLDVKDRKSIQAAKKIIEKKSGKIDILVNNAGINRPNDFDKITDEDWDAVMGTNIDGVFKFTQEFLPIVNVGGSIINISSVSGQYGGPRTTHYAVSKAGLLAFTQNLAIFCAPKGIRVNAVSPGLIESDMAKAAKNLGVSDKILMKRMGATDEVAKVVAFLAGSDSSYITAQTINVNGGLYF